MQEFMATDTPGTPAPQQNHLLASLGAEIQSRLFPHLELVSLSLGQILYRSGEALHYVYFPTDSIVSLLYVMDNGATVEISVVGNEGLIGVAVFMGRETRPNQATVQSAGSAYRLQRQLFMNEFNRGGEMQLLLLRYTQSLLTQMAQTAVCNRHHSIDQQLCRWLPPVPRSSAEQPIDDDPGVYRHYVRCAARGRDGCRQQVAEAGSDRISPRANHGAGPTEA
jgi:CRP-like cAMP-binding protein